MSSKLIGRVFDTAPYKGADLLVLVALADAANDDGIFWHSAPKLAAKCRMSPRMMRKHLAAFQLAGVLSAEPRSGRSNIWTLSLPWAWNPDNPVIARVPLSPMTAPPCHP